MVKIMIISGLASELFLFFKFLFSWLISSFFTCLIFLLYLLKTNLVNFSYLRRISGCTRTRNFYIDMSESINFHKFNLFQILANVAHKYIIKQNLIFAEVSKLLCHKFLVNNNSCIFLTHPHIYEN